MNDETNRVYEVDWGLQTRAKGSKLTHSQIMFLWNKVNKEGIPISELSRAYKLVPSILHKIKKLSKIEAIKLPRRKFNDVTATEKVKMISSIWKLYLSTNTSFTVSDMQSRLQANTTLHISKDLVLDLMKKDCNLSYTRCRSRPNNIDLSRVNSSRCLFVVKFSQIFDSRTLIINIDESSINTIENQYRKQIFIYVDSF